MTCPGKQFHRDHERLSDEFRGRQDIYMRLAALICQQLLRFANGGAKTWTLKNNRPFAWWRHLLLRTESFGFLLSCPSYRLCYLNLAGITKFKCERRNEKNCGHSSKMQMAYCSRCSRCSAVSSCYLNILIGSLRCHYDDGQRQRERHRLPLAKQQLVTSSTLFLDHFFADYDLRSNHVYIRRRISLIFSNLDIFL